MKNWPDMASTLIQHLPASRGFALFVLRRLRNGRCLEAAGSLTFTTLLALVPFLTITLTVVSAFPIFESFSNQFKIFLLANLVPDSAGRVISVYMRQFADNADRLTAMGTLTLAVTALAMMFTIDTTFNRIWRVRRSRPLLVSTLIYWSVLTLGPLIIGVSLTLTSWVAAKGAQLDGGLAHVLLSGGSLLLSFCGFTLLYRVVPNCPVPTRHALIAALIAAVCFECMKLLFGLYVKQFGTFKLVYGAFASFPIFLLWLYLAWVIVLGGAVLSAALSYWRGGAWRREPHPGQQVHDAARLLIALERCRLAGETPSLGQLRRRLTLGQDELHAMLELLARQGWVQPTRDNGWLLATALERITLRDLYHLIIRVPVIPNDPHDQIDRLLNLEFSKLDQSLTINLADLQRQADAADDGQDAGDARPGP